MALIFAICASAILIITGLAIDGARAYSLASRIGAALDAAALAGAKMLNETSNSDSQIQATVQATINAELARFGIGGVSIAAPSVAIDRANSLVTVNSRVTVQTLFGAFAGAPTIAFDKSSTTNYQVAKLEVVLALDITGSMNQIPAGDTQSKITTLKTVAVDVVNSLFDQATTDSNVRIGIVPWSSAVNAGAYAPLVNGTATTSWSPPTWGSHSTPSPTDCVVERGGSGKTTDDAPGAANYTSGAVTATCPVEDVAPLIGRTQRATLLSTISDFTAQGSTAGHIGAAWAWYLISPNWASYFPSESQPDPYHSATIKNVIIMTDGIFNTDYVVNSGSVGGYDDTSYTLFQQNCSGMRANGINVYTIALDLTDARAQSELLACAGVMGNYFNAANSTQLRAAFAEIIKRLNVVRVSK